MNTLYKPGDLVRTKVNNIEVEATVTKLSVEVEVKTADGKLYWRSSNRVRPADEQPVSEAPVATTGGNTSGEPFVETSVAEPVVPLAVPAAEQPAASASEDTEQPASAEAAAAQAEAQQPTSKRKRNRDRR